MEIESSFYAIKQAERHVLDETCRCGYAESDAFAIRLAVVEALNNAVRHGNCCDPAKKVCIYIDVDENRAEITVTDEGAGFDPKTVPDPTVDENLEKPCGRGIMLMHAYMDEVNFNERGNSVRLVKRVG